MNNPGPRYFTALPGGGGQPELRCELCFRRCVIPPGKAGRCGVRLNRGGRGEIPFYGYVTALAADPVEKKPLYHYRPGTMILSAGFAGCNLFCPFCQNHRISRNTRAPGGLYPPEELPRIARARGFNQIAYTYSEPLIHAEYLIDSMSAAREAGIARVLVSNGCAGGEAAGDILALTDAANIDLKSFSEDSYARALGGNLGMVLDFIRRAHEGGVHLELSTLIVPGLNDKPGELEEAGAFIAGLSPEIPWHLNACHPAYRWKGPPTSPEFLLECARRARKFLRHVYTGNLPGDAGDPVFTDTLCPSCGGLLVSRRGFRALTEGLALVPEGGRKPYRCRRCGEEAPFSY